MFSGSSSSPNSSSSNQNTPRNTFFNQNNFLRVTETFYFGNVKITAPFSESLKFQKIQGNPSPRSRVLIHNIFSYKQHFEKPRIEGAFYYSIVALNLWFNHLEERIKFLEETNGNTNNHETESLPTLPVSQTLPLIEDKTPLIEENNSLRRENNLLKEENEVLLKHFRELKRKHEATLFALNTEKNKVPENSSETVQNIFFSEKLQKRSIEKIKETFDEPIQAKIFGLKHEQELSTWIELANIIQHIHEPHLEKHHEHGCIKTLNSAACDPNCKFCFNICLLQINLDKFKTLSCPNSSSRFIQKFGLTFGLLLDLGFVKNFRFTGKRGHNKLRDLLGDEHFLVRTTNHFVTSTRPSQTIQVHIVSVPPAWINEERFAPAQHNFLISHDFSSWYQTMVTFTVNTKDYFNWRIHQSEKISSKPLGYGHKLMAQNSTARYYGEFKIASQVVPYATIEVSPTEAQITDELEDLSSTSNCFFLPGESQNDDVDDIDWETMRS